MEYACSCGVTVETQTIGADVLVKMGWSWGQDGWKCPTCSKKEED